MRVLNLGCGINRRRLYKEPFPDGTVHLDMNPDVEPDLLWDVNNGLPLMDWHPRGGLMANTFDEVHAYHLIEHVGAMGDTKVWFAFWRDCWRLLRPGGTMYVIAPYYLHEDAVGDPTHVRLIAPQTFHFLNRAAYLRKDGEPGCAMTKLDIDFDFCMSNMRFMIRKGETIPCGMQVDLLARKTADGGLVPESELPNAQQKVEVAA